MTLPIVWFAVIAILYAGFFLLEGFDFGVAMLAPFLGRDKGERGAILSTIGPHWDGNEVWLLTAGGATFAAFPVWYAALFSSMYPAFFLLLIGLILRGIALEFRGKAQHARWASAWEWIAAAGSLLAAFLLGSVFTSLVAGIALVPGGFPAAGARLPLQPVELLGGLAVAALCLMHGGSFLTLKLPAPLAERMHGWMRNLWLAALGSAAAYLITLLTVSDAFPRLGAWAIVVPVLAAGLLTAAGALQHIRRAGWAFVCSGAALVLAVWNLFVLLFPRVIVSNPLPENSLLLTDAASSPYTLTVMTVVAVIFFPLVVAYQIWTYRIFRQRVALDSKYD